jgi:hypothetical protein
MAKEFDICGKDLLSVVTRSDSAEWDKRTEEIWEFNPKANGQKRFKVVAYDFGIKSNILNRLSSLGCAVTVVPADTPASVVLDMNPDGVFFSNGPVCVLRHGRACIRSEVSVQSCTHVSGNVNSWHVVHSLVRNVSTSGG